MYPEFSSQSSQLFPLKRSLNDQHTAPNPSLASDGFNIWWQKTFAQHTSMAAEASALMLAHRRGSSASQVRVRQTH